MLLNKIKLQQLQSHAVVSVLLSLSQILGDLEMYCFSRMGCDHPSFVQRNVPPKLRILPLINAIKISKNSEFPFINLPSTFVISNEFAGIVLVWDTSSIYAKHLSEIWLMAIDVGSKCCFSHKLISLVLCCDVCKPSVILECLGYFAMFSWGKMETRVPRSVCAHRISSFTFYHGFSLVCDFFPRQWILNLQ